jgi:Cu+-exporting ATPase
VCGRRGHPRQRSGPRRLHEQEKQDHRTAAEPIKNTNTSSDRSGTLPLDLVVDGMWCTACAWVIETALSRLGGVQGATCHFSTDRLHCRYRPDRVAPDQIRKAVTRLGYRTRDPDTDDADRHAQRRVDPVDDHGTAVRQRHDALLGLVCGLLHHTLSGDAVSKISLPIVAMAAIVFVYGGGPMLRKAWFGLVHRAPGMETLVGMAAGCAFGYSSTTG